MQKFIANTPVDLLKFKRSTNSIVEEQVDMMNNECRDESFIIGDLGDIIKKYRKWTRLMPRITPFYAVKCNDEMVVLKLLADLGVNFDCASKGEIQKILGMNIPPSRIIYANPCKQSSMLKYAAKHNVNMMTFDNEAELYKVKNLYPSAKLVLRILPPSNFKVQCELGIKFGCHPSKAIELLQVARELDLDVMGVSFHVGSGCEEPEAFTAAIREARYVFDQAIEYGFDMQLLDIGGGFPGQKSSPPPFEVIAAEVNMALDKYFPAEEGVQIIAEPGRFFVASAFTLGVNIIAKRVVARDQQGENGELIDKPSMCDEPAMMYYVNDGVYGTLNCILYDHAHVYVSTVKDLNQDEITYESSIWGPTCDGLDCIIKSVQLQNHEVGDWLYFKDMGAYTLSAATTFNGMQGPARYYHCLQSQWEDVYGTDGQPETQLSRPMKKALAFKSGACNTNDFEMVFN